MRSIYAVFKREVKAYFTLPIAYVMMGGLLFIVGWLYYLSFRWFLGVSFEAMRNPMMASDLDISSMVVGATISTIGVVSVFTLPLLTMRLWAEEKRSGTVELLLTFPLRDSSIVLGKFFAGLAVYVVLLLLSLLYPLLAGLYAHLDPGPILAGYLGYVPPRRHAICLWLSVLHLDRESNCRLCHCLGWLSLFLAHRPCSGFCRVGSQQGFDAALIRQAP